MLKKLLAFVLIVFAVWFSFYSTQPHETTPTTAPKTAFSTARAFEHVKAIAQQPHYVGSAAHSRVRNYIVDQLQQMGLTVQTQENFVLNNEGILVRPQNILSRIKGTGNGDALVIMTHYDSHPHSSFGASDAGSGVATILEGIRAFLARDEKPKNDIILLFTDAEELGLNGAQLFIKDHPWAKDAKLAINFEARGSGGNSFMLLETNAGNAGLIKAFKKANPRYPVTNSLAYSVYKMLPNDTDLTVLREQGDVNGFNFAFIGDHFDYHTANDIPKNLDKESLAQQGSYLMPLLEYFKDADLNKLTSNQDLLYFTLPFGTIVSYPFSWIFPMLAVAALLFFVLLGYGLSRKRLSIKEIFRGFLPFLISLILSGLLVYLLWKFALYIYPQYDEILQGFPYNGYYYIAAALFLSLSISFFTYHKFYKPENTASLFVAPLFFWLLLCTLLSFYLKGAAYFIIPVGFGLLQLFVMIRQKKPNIILMALLSLPAIFILMPFVASFPVALGLKILFAAAILCVLLFSLLLPVFGYFKRKNGLAVLSFLIFNILFFTAHFQSDFNEDRPKPNSLVYFYNADEQQAKWYSYDKIVDEWTEPYFGKDPAIYPSPEENFSSKYSSGFTFMAKAPVINLQEPKVLIQKDSSAEKNIQYSMKIAPNRDINRMEIFVDRKIDFEDFSVNGLKAEDIYLGENAFNVFTERWDDRLLTYYASGRDTLRLKFSLKKGVKPDFVLYESSYDLLKNDQLHVAKRPKSMIPMPFVVNDAVIVKKTISLE